MECRRINTSIIGIGHILNEDSVKRSQYITQINCKVPGKEAVLGKIFRYVYKRSAYYGVISEDGHVCWFSVSSTGSFIRKYPLTVTSEYTNIFAFLKNEYLSENRPEKSISTTSETAVCISGEHAFIECPEQVNIYDISGRLSSKIDTGVEKVESMHSSHCGEYLFIFYQRGSIHLYNVHKRETVYKKKHAPGRFFLFGDVLKYARYLLVSKNSAFIERAYDGETLLELAYPEELCCASMDVLQTRIVSGSTSGKIYQTRLDGEKAEFSESKISSEFISSLFFSLCGSVIYAVSAGSLFSISLRDGKILQRMPFLSERYIFTRTTSSNLHLQ